VLTLFTDGSKRLNVRTTAGTPHIDIKSGRLTKFGAPAEVLIPIHKRSKRKIYREIEIV
jgi:hypothetical protein